MRRFVDFTLIYGIPTLILFGQALIEIYLPNELKPAFHSEEGPHEALEAVFLILAFPLAVYLTFKAPTKWLKAWTALAAVCCFYVAGEELSWGQHIFEWSTPENWSQLNDQGETNLHNTSTWLDQKPRALLVAGVIVGGLIIPALRKWKPSKLPAKFKDIYPDNRVVFTAVIALCVKTANAIGGMTGHHLFWRGSEIMEIYMFYFVLIYLLGQEATWRKNRLN